MSTIRRLFAVLAVGLMPAAAFAWHNHLKKSAPAADEQLSASPTAIRLWFAENPDVKLSTVTVQARDSSKVSLGPVTATDDPSSISAAVPSRLSSGENLVTWRTAGNDGHAVRGKFSFWVE